MLSVFRDGSLWIVVEDGQPSDPLLLGIGDTLQAAKDNREQIGLQSDGRYPVTRALDWAHAAGWISEPSSLEEEADEEAEEGGHQDGRTISLADISTLVMPAADQGQTVETSYGWLQDGSGTLVRCRYDRSDRSETWHIADGSGLDESWDAANGAPAVPETAWDAVEVR